ncbi:magnesium transporter [Candidatus Uabimicrobium sp. HlEnr_7]|uniref:magnesium transporter n=1 Tax=Candidatus Uabimicrobium helgolandensis TaxID=3095367 RepID=UPI0035564C56
MKTKNYRKAVQSLLSQFSKDEKAPITHSIFTKAHAADIAEIISHVSEDRQLKVFDALDVKQRGDVFVELPEDLQSEFIEETDDQRLLALFKELEPDEAADFLSLLDEDRQQELLSELPQRLQRKFRTLLLYGEESAGGIMTSILLTVHAGDTVNMAIEQIREYKSDEIIINVYIVDQNFKLIGSVPLQNLIIADGKAKIEDIMELSPIAVNVNDDQEIVGQTVRKYNLLSVPVIDDAGKLLGRITMDDVIDVVHEEADEDVYRMAGVDSDEIHVDSGFAIARMRLPWLSICLGGSMVSAFVLQNFESILSKSMVLIAFLPAICAMGGNSGLQTSTVTIRNLTYEAVFHSNRKKLARRELLSGVIIGITCGFLVCCISLLWLGNIIYGLIIGSSMLLTIFFSTCTGFFIPIFFSKLKIDPAIASGPLITTLNDAMSAFIYLAMASLQLKYFGLL